MTETLVILLFAFDIRHGPLVAVILALGYLPMFGSYYEQYYTQTLYFESISSFEAIAFSTVISCVGFARPPLRNALNFNLTANVSVFEISVGLAAAVGLVLMLRNLHRTGKSGNKWLLTYFVFAACVVVAAPKYFSGAQLMAVVGLYCAAYVERLMLAYVYKKREPIPDFIFAAFLLVADILKWPVAIVAPIGLAYNIAVIVGLFLYGFIPQRDGWVWVNPKASETSEAVE
jgi:hypothetical protein